MRLGPVFPLAVARNYVRSIGEHLIVPVPAVDQVFARRVVGGTQGVVAALTPEDICGAAVILTVNEEIIAVPA